MISYQNDSSGNTQVKTGVFLVIYLQLIDKLLRMLQTFYGRILVFLFINGRLINRKSLQHENFFKNLKYQYKEIKFFYNVAHL